MSRRSNAELENLDLSQRHRLTEPMIAAVRCPAGKAQAFLRDKDVPGLAVRVTPSGVKTYVFESKLHNTTLRLKVGKVGAAWPLEQARVEARKLRVQIDAGQSPKRLRDEQAAANAAHAAATKRERERDALTVREAWDSYVADRKAAKKDGRPRWGALHIRDHERAVCAGGVKAARGTRGRGETIAGPLHALMDLKLRELTPDRIRDWAAAETQKRPTVSARAWRLLRGFLSWCAEQPAYAEVLPPRNPANVKSVREAIATPKPKRGALLKEQLAPWFAAVRSLSNASIAAYLQVLLLTGARPGEVQHMLWANVNERWRGVTIRDKDKAQGGERTIPLTPYIAHLLAGLPQVNEYVFASPIDDKGRKHKPMSLPHKAHHTACAVAGINALTLHDLRRSFKTLTQWLDLPAGVEAQLMGHKPSATAEKHYTVRPLDLLRNHQERVEAWILEQAGISDAEWKAHAEESAANGPARKLRRIK